MPRSLWLFDFDNTIARLEPVVDWAASRRELEPMLRAAGAPQPLFERFPKGNLLLYDAYRAHLSGLVRRDGGEHEAILRQASEIIEKYELMGVDRAEPLEGAVNLLSSLCDGRRMVGIVTSNSSRTVKRWLEVNRASQFVKLVVGRDSLLPLKPASDMLVEALKISSVNATDANYVGDTVNDYQAASAAGVGFYGIAGSDSARDSLIRAGVAMVFASPSALAIHLGPDFSASGPKPRGEA